MCHTGQILGSPEKFYGVGKQMEQGSALPADSASPAPWGARGHKREQKEQESRGSISID